MSGMIGGRVAMLLALILLTAGTAAGAAEPELAADAASEAPVATPAPAEEGELTLRQKERWLDGWWRIELDAQAGIHSGTRDRSGDFQLSGAAEYEIPVHERTTIGLRLLPLFLYDGPDLVWGAGAGLSVRLYQIEEEYEGFFVEGFGHALVTTDEFEGNSSQFNFLIGGGVGYQFPNDWHLALRYEHISNASIGSRNAGINTVGMAVGFRF